MFSMKMIKMGSHLISAFFKKKKVCSNGALDLRNCLSSFEHIFNIIHYIIKNSSSPFFKLKHFPL